MKMSTYDRIEDIYRVDMDMWNLPVTRERNSEAWTVSALHMYIVSHISLGVNISRKSLAIQKYSLTISAIVSLHCPARDELGIREHQNLTMSSVSFWNIFHVVSYCVLALKPSWTEFAFVSNYLRFIVIPRLPGLWQQIWPPPENLHRRHKEKCERGKRWPFHRELLRKSN